VVDSLAGKCVIEYPCIYVALPDEADEFPLAEVAEVVPDQADAPTEPTETPTEPTPVETAL
jgi:hypothetical protein